MWRSVGKSYYDGNPRREYILQIIKLYYKLYAIMQTINNY